MRQFIISLFLVAFSAINAAGGGYNPYYNNMPQNQQTNFYNQNQNLQNDTNFVEEQNVDEQDQFEEEPFEQQEDPDYNDETDPVLEDAPAQENVESLLKVLEDPKLREEVIASIKGLQSIQAKKANKDPVVDLLGHLRQGVKRISNTITNLKNELLDNTQDLKNGKPFEFIPFLKDKAGPLLLLLFCLFALQYVVAIVLKAPHPPFFRQVVAPFKETHLKALLPVAAFFVAGYILTPLFSYSSRVEDAFTKIILLICFFQLSILAVRIVLAAEIVELRPEVKRRLVSWAISLGLVYVAIESITFSLALAGIPFEAVHVYRKLFYMLFTALVVLFLFRQRLAVRSILMTEEAKFSPFVQHIYGFILLYLHVILSAIVVSHMWAYLIDNDQMQQYIMFGIQITVGLLLGNKLIAYIIQNYLTSQIKHSTVYHSTIISSTKNTTLVLSLAFVMYYWLSPVVRSLGIKEVFAFELILNLALILLVMSLAIKTLDTFIESRLNPIDNYGMLIKPNPRVQTFFPIIGRLGKIAIYLIGGLLLLSEFGVNISPLLAGLGVFGLALSLGTQNIIKDFVSGLFILAENEFNVGDNVIIDGVSGKVEDTSFRHVMIRDVEGYLHLVPYGNIKRLVNKSRDYNTKTVEIPLMEHESLSSMVKLYESVAGQMVENKKLKDAIIEPPRFIGVDEIKPRNHYDPNVTATMLFRLKTIPGESFVAAREFLRLAKMAQEEIARYNSDSE